MFHCPNEFRIKTGQFATTDKDGNNGLFILPMKRYSAKVVISQDPIWEHVSVSLSNRRNPNWKEMCAIKSIFWDPNDCIVQFHPPESEYINNHPHCLHLWRSVRDDFPQPPAIMVGLPSLNKSR